MRLKLAQAQAALKMPMKRILRKFSALRKSEPTRLHPRVRLATDVAVEGHGFIFTARSVQLGTQGMSLQDAGQLSLSQPVVLSFHLPSGYLIRVAAVVWWKTKELVGLRFDPRDADMHMQEWVRTSAASLG